MTHPAEKGKNSENIIELNSIINQLDLINIYKIFHPTVSKYTFFLSSPGILTKIGHSSEHQTSLNKPESLQAIQGMLFSLTTI